MYIDEEDSQDDVTFNVAYDKGAFRGTAAKSQSASSRAFLRWGHDRFGRDPERAWERTRSSPAPTTPLAPLADHFRTVTPPSEKHYPEKLIRKC